jgi:hypothetical protein
MNSFPKLKTGAVMQYPAIRTVGYSTEVFRFLDGTEQRYRVRGGQMRRWVVRLDLLDETELAALEQFFESMQGAYGSFAFKDPWDGKEYLDCSLESDEFAAQMTGEMRARTSMVIRENRS